MVRGAWIPNGAEGPGPLTHEANHLRFGPEGRRTACACSLLVVSVTPSLDLVSCCGLNLEYIPELHVSSVRDRSLGAALAEVRPDLLKMWIHVEGPERVLEFVKEKAPEFQLPLDSAHICHTCQYLHDSPRSREILRRFGHEVETRILEKYLLVAAGNQLAARL